MGSFEQMLARRKKSTGSTMYMRKNFAVGSLMAPSNPPMPLENIEATAPLYVKKTNMRKTESVAKAAYPNYAGFTPEYEAKTQASSTAMVLTKKNAAAN